MAPQTLKGYQLNIITTREQLDEMVAYYLKQDAFAFDVETVGARRGVPVVNQVLWISLATHGRGDVIPLGHPNGEFISESFPLTGQGEKRVLAGLQARESDYSRDRKKATKTFGPAPEQLFPAEVFEALKPLFFSDKLKVGHNLVFDLCSVSKYLDKKIPTGPYFDTMVGSFVYDNRNKNKCGLDDCLKRELGYEMEKGVGAQVEVHPFSTVAKYAYLDAKYTFLLWKEVAKKITEADLDNIMNLEMGVLEVLCHMKLHGAPIDTEQLAILNTQLEIDIEKARAEIYKIAGRVFNINSNQEKQYLLYSKKSDGGQGLSPKILTAKGQDKEMKGIDLDYIDYSVSAEALEPYREKNLLVHALLTYADLNKLQSTYVIPYLGGDVVRTVGGKSKVEYKESLLVDGRIHADFIQHGAETGRFSSRNPNLQNVPNPATAHGKAIRNLFYAPPGYKLVVADYSQIEPRIIASMSKDPTMVKNYVEGGDIYTTVGDVMKVNRQAGKVLVLSMAYGVGPDKIARSIGCTVTEARTLLGDFADKFKSVNIYRIKVIGATRSKQYVSTLMGRKRYLPEINSRDFLKRGGAERQAFNTRIQGSAADIMKLAMIRAHQMIPEGASILLTVHDELVTLTPDNLVEETKEAIREAMEGINLLEVPLIADVKVVQRWGEAK
jgi:DNA polymerase I-like protein with 3'-5' exonuclease and polymerase domains